MAQMEQQYDKNAQTVLSENISRQGLERLQMMTEQEQQVENLVSFYGLFF